MKFKVSGICAISVGDVCAEANEGILEVPDEFVSDPSWPRLYSELLRDPGITIEHVVQDAPADATEAESAQGTKDEADAIRASLKAAGIPFGPRTGIDKLRELAAKIAEGK